MSSSPANWREYVSMSYRNKEVRAIAKMLADLEPGRTVNSLLPLAARFEQAVYIGATSLANYRMTLAKKLKKFQKNYKSQPQTAHTAALDKEERLLTLKNTWGEKLLLIVQNADKAIQAIKLKNDAEKAKTLEQHTDNAKLWARDLGILEGSTLNTAVDADRLQMHLETRVDNIRSHVIKFAHVDLFLHEALGQLESNLKGAASQVLAIAANRRLEGLVWSHFDDPVALLKQSLETAQVTIPPPSRDKESKKQAALQHLERLRSTSQVFVAFTAIPDKSKIPRNALDQAFSLASQSIEILSEITPQLVGTNEKGDEVKLEDAWTKVLPLDNVSFNQQQHGESKRLKVDTTTAPVIKSRVLLTPGRKTPSNLFPELKRKRVKLVRPPPNGQGTHLIVEFGNAFVMTIYLVPLIVTLRAADKKGDSSSNNYYKTASWTPASANLGQHSLQVFGVEGDGLAHVVEEQLEYASAHATQVLRKCFANTSKAKNDFEVEISEATALLHFLHLARTTYMPNFEEDSDV